MSSLSASKNGSGGGGGGGGKGGRALGTHAKPQSAPLLPLFPSRPPPVPPLSIWHNFPRAQNLMRQQIPTQTKNKWISLLSLSLSLSLHLTNWILHCRATVALAAAPSLSISFFCRLTTRPPLAVGTQTRGTLLILLYLPSHCSLSLLQPPQKVKKKRRRRRRRETERGPLLPLPLPHPSSPPRP